MLRLVKAIDEAQTTYLHLIRSKMRRKQYVESMQPAEVVRLAGVIVARVQGGAWAAMDIFGRGSKMSISNRALMKYMSDPVLWNVDRNTLKIVTRRKPYTDIFGEHHPAIPGMPNIGGLNLEDKLPKFEPWEPSRALEDATKEMKVYDLKRILLNELNAINWSAYILATKD